MAALYANRRYSGVRSFTNSFLSLLLASLVITGCDSTKSDTPTDTSQPSLTLQLSTSLLELGEGDAARLEVLQNGGASQIVLRNKVTWTTADPAIAAVDGGGMVLGRSAGETTVQAKTTLGTATARVRVGKGGNKSVAVSPRASTLNAVGDTLRLVATVTNRGGNVMQTSITWSSLNPSIVTVNASGTVFAKAPGAAKVVAAAASGADTVDVAVGTAAATQIITVSVTPSTTTVTSGDTIRMVATAADAKGTPLAGTSFSWSTSNKTVATVSPTGVVTTLAEGSATITATMVGTTSGSSSIGMSTTASLMQTGGKSASAGIVVRGKSQDRQIQSVTASPRADTLNALGDTAQFSVTVRDAQGTVIQSPTVTWTSLNPNIATVDALGRVISKAVGVALITAACGDKADTVTVHSRQIMAAVSVTPSSAKVLVGDSLRLGVAPADSNGVTMSGVDVTWSTANPEIATVSANGVVRGLKAGSVQVTATSGTSRGATTIAVETAPIAPPPPPPSNSGAVPELPRVYVETAYRQPTGNTIRVAAGGNLQNAINSAQPGDVILLQAGATFRGSFTLPKKDGNGWITIRSDVALPAEGTRVTPATAANFAKLVGGYEFAVSIPSGSRGYRLMGLEITTDVATLESKGQIVMNSGSSDIIVDRSYVHGHTELAARRCIIMNAANAAVIDSHVSDCHIKGFDSQAILVYNTPGPLKVVNNFLEGAGENMMVGGALPAEGVVPSDIEVRRNHLFKPLSWRNADGTSRWTVKNSFELKIGRRILIEGNILENHWKDAQDGDMVNIKFDQSGCTWCGTEDITMRYNIFRNSSGGIQIGGINRMLFAHNIFENISAFPGTNTPFSLVTGNTGMILERNTSTQHGKLSLIDGGAKNSSRILNNLLTRGSYGWKGSGTGEGSGTLNYYFPEAVFTGNAIVGADATRYPTGNHFPTSVDAARTIPGIGADENAVRSATAGVVR